MWEKRFTAAALGVAIAFLLVGHFHWHSNDMAYAFAPAARASEPYSAEGRYFYYPAWALYFLKGILILGEEWATVGAGLLCIIVTLVCSREWGTPEWVALIAPPFLVAVGYAHPFEAITLLGLTLAVQGYAGPGLALLMFKPQLGFVPGIYIAWQHRKEWQVFIPSAVLAIGTTCLDIALTGRLWVIPFYQMARTTPALSWNSSLWGSFGWLSLLWLPIGLWVLLAQKNEHGRLFVAYALGLLLMPYWGALSLWPLVAMAGVWREKVTLAIGKHSFGGDD